MRPAGPGDDEVMDRKYVERGLAHRWDRYKHGEDDLRAVWFWVSWWLSKTYIRAIFLSIVFYAVGLVAVLYLFTQIIPIWTLNL
jgi:hypothetical protein